ncbi:hypothetical protein P154DRAFT_571110 [Amniculicola lignicola CBS 123094]|uniref:Uncharacterized protein n=1 Tax=Amniculicola lignicola CBS 123094 TaxID=1392246 RepID=A0A6A5X2F4_9PLEO|nr:hypothetical protein P154DRAFT_571110 [Amniculicola lignicola CBS 123094]
MLCQRASSPQIFDVWACAKPNTESEQIPLSPARPALTWTRSRPSDAGPEVFDHGRTPGSRDALAAPAVSTVRRGKCPSSTDSAAWHGLEPHIYSVSHLQAGLVLEPLSRRHPGPVLHTNSAIFKPRSNQRPDDAGGFAGNSTLLSRCWIPG